LRKKTLAATSSVSITTGVSQANATRGSTMRYHEATAIRKDRPRALATNVVISHGAQWYDVRVMTEKELEEFMADCCARNSAN
jgi:hypothetical protein